MGSVTAIGVLTLDADQAEVAAADPETRQIVLAGPGSGKTEVVSALLRNLVDDHGLSPADEVLVVSFSRAAVAAVRRRTAGDRRGRPAPSVRTLDSLASALVMEDDGAAPVGEQSFDERVTSALHLLTAGAVGELDLVRHLIVDEIQDVVGIRAEFLLAVLQTLNQSSGFTLLGDPLQAIYDFQSAPGDMDSVELLERVRAMDGVKECRLVHQYRAKASDANEAVRLGEKLQAAAELDEKTRHVEHAVARLPAAGDITSLSRVLAKWSGSTAILCRTNGEALAVSQELRDRGVPAGLQSAATDTGIAPWVSQVLGEVEGPTITREHFDELARNSGQDPADAWGLLRAVTGGRGRTLEVHRLATRLAAGVVPVELKGGPAPDVTVSTIHRAKGLEFDNVVLLDPLSWTTPERVNPEAIRTAFVALTRSRSRLATAQWGKRRWLTLDPKSGRWVQAGSKRWQTFGFELRATDCRQTAAECGPETQSFLSGMPTGLPVHLKLDPRRSTLETPIYSVRSNDLVVGFTNESFGEALCRRIGPATRRRGLPWPALHGAYLEGVETIVDPAQQRAGRPPFWLGVRAAGLLTLEWESKGRDG